MVVFVIRLKIGLVYNSEVQISINICTTLSALIFMFYICFGILL